MADQATQSPDSTLFPSVPAMTQTQATAPNGAAPGPVSPLMQFISAVRAKSEAAQAPTAPAPGPTMQAAKQYQDPLGVSALAAAHNIPTETAGAIHEPQNHSLDEFLKSTDGIPWGKLKQIVAMRHVLTPQEQAQQTYLQQLQQGGNPDAYAKGITALAFNSPYLSSGAPVPQVPQGLADMISQLRASQQPAR